MHTFMKTTVSFPLTREFRARKRWCPTNSNWFFVVFSFCCCYFFYYRYRDLHVNDILSLSNESGRSHPVGKSHLILCFVITSSRLKKLETEQSKNLLLIVNRCQLYLWKKLRIFHISLKIHHCT